MKKIIFLAATLLCLSVTDTQAQTRSLKKVLELQMPKTKEDDYCGTRGAAVCWNPDTRKYYAAFAGNTQFPMGVFDISGKRISDESLTTQEDIRGLWYVPQTKTMMANGYSDIGWISYSINEKGIPYDIQHKYSGQNQPDAQSVGTYNADAKRVYFLDKGRILVYEDFEDLFARVDDSVQIHWGRTKTQGAAADEDAFSENNDYNSTTAVYTGVNGAEAGLLNTAKSQIELYDIKTGFLKQTLALPANTPVESMFNFAYANGIYWLFDIENRKWLGFK